MKPRWPARRHRWPRPLPWPRLQPQVAWLLAVALLVQGCLPASASTQSDQIAWLYGIFLGAASVVFVIVWGLLTFAVLRYRRRTRTGEPTDDLPPQTDGNTRLEIIWTALPTITIIVLFALTLGVLNALGAQPPPTGVRISPGIGGLLPSPGGGGAGAEARSGPVEIGVIGSRWGWTFSYGQAGIVVTGTGIPGPEAVVPADEPVRFVVTATDVIHSFYVPQFLAKYDAVPGRSYTFEATIRPGTYGGQCAEYCGLLHAEMPFSVHAVPRAEYQAWLLQQPRVP